MWWGVIKGEGEGGILLSAIVISGGELYRIGSVRSVGYGVDEFPGSICLLDGVCMIVCSGIRAGMVIYSSHERFWWHFLGGSDFFIHELSQV